MPKTMDERLDARTFFTAEERRRIDEAVAAAERGTSGEIVPVLATRSDEYDVARYRAGIALALQVSLFVAFAVLVLGPALDESLLALPAWVPLGAAPLLALLLAQGAALLLGGRLVDRLPGLARTFVPRALMAERVQRAARDAFLRYHLGATREATGIMIYVSLFEHMVVVLADRAVNEKHPPATWDGVRDILIQGIREGRPAEAFLRAIDECGKILAKDLPRRADDTDELPNHLRVIVLE